MEVYGVLPMGKLAIHCLLKNARSLLTRLLHVSYISDNNNICQRVYFSISSYEVLNRIQIKMKPNKNLHSENFISTTISRIYYSGKNSSTGEKSKLFLLIKAGIETIRGNKDKWEKLALFVLIQKQTEQKFSI